MALITLATRKHDREMQSTPPFSGTNTGQALEHALDDLLAVKNGNRPDVPDLVLVITDGVSDDDITLPAKKMRDSGATVSQCRYGTAGTVGGILIAVFVRGGR